MKILLITLSLLSFNVLADRAPEEVVRYFDGVSQPECGKSEIVELRNGDAFAYGVKGAMNSYQQKAFNTFKAFGESFTTQFKITQKENFEILNLSIYSLAEGGSWAPDRPGIIWGVDKYTFKIVKDITLQKIVSIEKHELIRRRTILGGLKRSWKEENSSPSCSDI